MKKFLSRFSKLSLSFICIDIILVAIFLFNIFRLNVLPMKYLFILVCAILLLLTLIILFTQRRSRKIFKIFGVIFSIIILSLTIMGTYFTGTLINFLSKFNSSNKVTYTETYYVLSKNNQYNDIKELNDKTVGYFINMSDIELSLNKLKETINFETKEYENIFDSFNEVKKDKIAGSIVEKNLYDALKEVTDELKGDTFKILYTYEIQVEKEVSKKEVNGDYVNIYIGGRDFAFNHDFNMIVTINKKTHKILLTSIPRDFYVYVPGIGMKELLGYASPGADPSNSIGALENLFDTDINYFVEIETDNFVDIVDVVGGVEFCSDKSFTTTHALVLNTYNDSTGPKLKVEKGCKTYKGIEILTIARERLAYPDGDRQRQKNCQEIIISLFKKMSSLGSLANFSNILDKVSNLYTTNVPQDLITEIAKSAIDGTSWEFTQQSVTGNDSSGYVHRGTVQDYVMQPNQDSINNAKAKMKGIMYES